MKILKYINKILPFKKQKLKLNEIKSVLVVSNTGFGDTLLSTPSIKTLRKSFPKLDITFLVNHNFYTLFEGFEYVNRIVKYKKGLLNQLKIISKLRDYKVDVIFLFHSNGPEDIFFSKLSGTKHILKMTHNNNHEYKNIFLNNPVLIEQHDIENRLDLVRILNPKIVDTCMEIPKMFYNDNNFFKDTSKRYIAFQMGAQDTFKMWPVSKFIALANKIHHLDDNIDIVILGATKYEQELTTEFISKIDKKDRIYNLCAVTKIELLPKVLNSCDLLITNDTGTMHLAIALKKQTICLFGPTNSKLFGPYQNLNLHSVIHKDVIIDTSDFNKKNWSQETMNEISLDEVFSKVLERIEEKS